ncbi:MAG: tRNA (adenosine(37)-N6)-dimethylallyltransferase MiaA [Lachnospiraceae bacterium]|nr:tRNA (adenosine(37)-N6)-dimethylallyltransferase MiaA [Lachnospiraceae bacterium]
MTQKRPLIVIAGPTAVGKSELAAELGRRIHGEVISADSMQVYRHMDIGSAKVTLEEMLGVPHHLIDVVEPTEEMDVTRYAELAQKALEGIYERGNVPILCGGTGFYIQAVTRCIDFSETTSDPALREELHRFAEEHGTEALHAKLQEVDPEAAAAIHPNNLKRVIRALEYYRATGNRISDHNKEEQQKVTPYDLVYIFLDDERDVLYKRIDRRVDFMMEEGLADEVAFLRAMGVEKGCTSMQGIGYKEIINAMDGQYSMDEAVEIIKRESRRYAKRQETWFKREQGVIRIMRGDYQNDTFRILDHVLDIIKERLGIEAEEVGNPYE